MRPKPIENIGRFLEDQPSRAYIIGYNRALDGEYEVVFLSPKNIDACKMGAADAIGDIVSLVIDP